jgi:phosphate transport system substrate-binding protein
VKKGLIICFVALFALAASLGYSQENTVIRVNGAGMAANQVQIWAQQFMAENPHTNIIVTGSSAGKGFQALFDKHAELALASREISPGEEKTAEEKGLKLEMKFVGNAGVAIITSPNNQVNDLTIDQLRRIYLGQIDNWKEVGGTDSQIRPMCRKIPESGGAVFFWEHVMGKEPFGSKVVLAETWHAIIKTCQTATDLPVGVAPGFVARTTGGIKVLAIKKDANSPAIKPSEETLRNHSYPIILKFSFYWDQKTKNDKMIKFIDFCEKKGLSER